ncbi:tail fiber domain-containing protein [Foetidibacter luteolus]|uniref:tail fiber domain-containing protein n=1 Tax=Foetidibacter luteolus TaxID=2608880 RepID=UPI001A9936E1|nr:tail fiber domain-containing protein [Foetidibacter luteolus]
MGSSTVLGIGAEPRDSGWARKFNFYVKAINPGASVTILSRYSTYMVQPTGYVPPLGRPAPEPDYNITKALSLQPDAIIINFPSNDEVENYTQQERQDNIRRLTDAADNANVPVWVATPQPRNYFTAEKVANQYTMIAWTNNTYGTKAVDFFTGLGSSKDSIAYTYNSGDGVHMNNAGHDVLFQRILAEEILDSVCIRNGSTPPPAGPPEALVDSSLVPAYNDSLNLGNSAKQWQNLYLGNSLYLQDKPVLSLGGLNSFFTGPDAGSAASTGSANTAAGYEALNVLGTGNNNTSVGFRSLYNNNSGSNNTAIGYNALLSNRGAANNTALGYNAGSLYTGNSYNLFLGANTQASGTGISYSSAIGYGAVINASNKMQLGTSATTIATSGGVTIVSDGRFKDNIKDNDVPGLDFVKQLHPVTYNMNYTRLENFLRSKNPGEAMQLTTAYTAALAEKSRQRQAGFIAQEIEELCKKKGYTFNAVYAPQNENDNYAIDYSRLVVPLVKAVQELSAANEKLSERITRLEAALESANYHTAIATTATLEQNIPNPFKEVTTISYHLPQKYTSAKIFVYDADGKTRQQINVNGYGAGNLKLDASSMPAGAYSYALVVNGKLAGAKKMLVIK